MPTAEQCRNCRKLSTRQCTYYTDEYGRECSNFEQRKPTLKLTESEVRILVISILGLCILFITLASVSYFSQNDGIKTHGTTETTITRPSNGNGMWR